MLKIFITIMMLLIAVAYVVLSNDTIKYTDSSQCSDNEGAIEKIFFKRCNQEER